MIYIKTTGIYIPSLEAKDILSSAPGDKLLRGFDGHYNLRRFSAGYDFSQDFIKLGEVYFRTYRRANLTFFTGGKEYSPHVIRVTFDYAYHEFNRVGGAFIRAGENYDSLSFTDCIAYDESGKIAGIITDREVIRPVNNLAEGFCYNPDKRQYERIKKDGVQKGTLKTVKTRAELRRELYENGFQCDGRKYVRWKRSAGSARVGRCLFINEELFNAMRQWELCGLDVKDGDEIDLAGLESSISLVSSSIIGTINIPPKSILVTNDYDSEFFADAVAVRDNDGQLEANDERVKISNSIWDGQSLIDTSAMGEYRSHGMILLRNRFFKSCCFNTRIQDFFKDKGVTSVEQLNGFTLAKRVEDIKLITTPNSIKYAKFAAIEDWLNRAGETFGVVKYDKPTHYFDGRLVQTHYQLLNTLQLSEKDIGDLLAPSFDFAERLRSDPAVVRYYIKYPDSRVFEEYPMLVKNDVVRNMMSLNDRFTQTKYYQDFLDELLRAFYKNLKCGHVLVNGNYSTLAGNPVEMLYNVIGQFDGTNLLGIGNVCTSRFDYGKTLLASRSPHVCCSNVLLVKNVRNSEIEKYFRFTPEIVAVNSIGEATLDRLSGCDFDSDTVMLTDNDILIGAAKKNYHLFKTPVSRVSASKIKRYYTAEQLADLDIKTSVNKIGEIINFSQVLNSLFWDRINKGASFEECKELYHDIVILDVMSGIEIDSAKREFDINNSRELQRLSAKYKDVLTSEDERHILPQFFAHISRQKGYYNSDRNYYKKHLTSMDYLQTAVNSFRVKASRGRIKPHESLLTIFDYGGYDKRYVAEGKVPTTIAMAKQYAADRKRIYMSVSDPEERRELITKRLDEFIDEFNGMHLKKNAILTLARELDKDENADCRTVIIKGMLDTSLKSLMAVLKESEDEIFYLAQGGNDVELYGIGFCKYSRYSTIGFERYEAC